MSTRIARDCDACTHEGKSAGPAQAYGPILGKMIDLCPVHYGHYLDPLEQLLDKYGVPVTPPASTAARAQQRPLPTLGAGTMPCPVCEDQHSRGGLGAHMRRIHGTSIYAALGSQCGICGYTGKGGTGLGAHVGRAHPELGLSGVVEAWWWAVENGDPAGVVASRTAALEALRAA